MDDTKACYCMIKGQKVTLSFEAAGDKGYEGFFEKFKKLLLSFCNSPSESGKGIRIVVLPFLSSTSMNSYIGLEFIRKEWLNAKAQTQVKTVPETGTYYLFVVPFNAFLPDFHHPESVTLPAVVKLLKSAPFGETEKAVLLVETLWKETAEDPAKDLHLLNFFSLQEGCNAFLQCVEGIVTRHAKRQGLGLDLEKAKTAYYETFADFYNFKKETISDTTVKDFIDELKNESSDYTQNELYSSCQNKKLYPVLELADLVYHKLNGMTLPKKSGTHNIPLEHFRSPEPFPFQEIPDALETIHNALHDRKIRLLLIDNKPDKFGWPENGNKVTKGSLPCLFETFGVASLFELEVLPSPDSIRKKFLWRGGDGKKEDEKSDGYFVDELKGEEGKTAPADPNNLFSKDGTLFDYQTFRKGLTTWIENPAAPSSDSKYALETYKRIKSAHFVLLDFFLDSEGTYLAFDFIKDINRIKNLKGDTFITWYFITSAVFDSVMKYAQSGRLAQYESSVVNAGDDPGNEKRQIIFLYKLLTFILARIQRFNDTNLPIKEKLLVKGECPDFPLKKGGCGETCVNNTLLVAIRKLLSEIDAVSDIFFNSKKEDVKNLYQRLERILEDFILLKEADWFRIQVQIDQVNLLLEDPEKLRDFTGRKFSCRYILEVLTRRSNIF